MREQGLLIRNPVVPLPLTAPVFSVRIRFDILDQEMKTLMTQIDGVNLAANNLVESGHPRSGEVKQYQDRLNKRWGVGRAVAARGKPMLLSASWG